MKNKIKQFLKENYGYLVLLILLFIMFFVKFPYYIDAPGGIINVNERIDVDYKYNESGSFNLSYVSEYDANLLTLLISVFNKEWEVIKKEDVLLENENEDGYVKRDKLLMDESISNAIYVAYNKAFKDIEIKNQSIKVGYIYKNAKTDLKISDEILKVNNIKIHDKEQIKNLIKSSKIGNSIILEVKNNNRVYKRHATIIDNENTPAIGIIIVQINGYVTKPEISIKTEKKESGPSGGLMLALSIYNKLTKEDITNGLTIVGTGTIEKDFTVGSVGGIEYKLKSAVKSNADLFIVPNGENYEEAKSLKRQKQYDIKIIGVSTFDDAIEYLKKTK